MDKKIIKEIKQIDGADWGEITPRLLKYAYGKCFRAYGVTNDHTIAKGMQPTDLTNEAIEDLLSGKRTWNPDEQPHLLEFLKGVVDSKANHLINSWSNKNEIPSQFRTSNPRDEDNIQEFDIISEEAHPNPPPDDMMASNEQASIAKKIVSQLYKLASGDDEVEGLLLCMEEEIFKPKEIAAQLDISILSVNNAQKRLRRLAARLTPSYKALKAE